MFDICIVGHITKDLICIDGKLQREMPGGTAYYTSIALKHLGLKVAVITKVARADQEHLLSDLHRCGIAVCCQDSEETTIFENCYWSETEGLCLRANTPCPLCRSAGANHHSGALPQDVGVAGFLPSRDAGRAVHDAHARLFLCRRAATYDLGGRSSLWPPEEPRVDAGRDYGGEKL